ncbi:MAG TPA: XRE family transcriptional regulator [Ktedonobacterales bacterium]
MAGTTKRQGRREDQSTAGSASDLIPAGQLASHFSAVWEDGARPADGASAGEDEADIGHTIHRFREERQLSLKDLAAKSGLTQSFLSQVERGLTSPSVASLRKIAQAFGAPLAALFQGPSPQGKHVVRRDQRRQLMQPGGQWRDYLMTPNLQGRLQVIWSVIEPGGGSGDEAYAHDSDEECVVILRGRLEFWVGQDHYTLDEGDSIVFESRIPHRNVNPGPDRAEVLWITTPPSY